MKKLGKKELVEKMVALGLYETKVEAAKAVAAFTEATQEIVNEGNMLTLVGFGSFKTVTKGARKIKHPSTREVLDVPERTMAKFIPSKIFLYR